jgi:hypothetical protein
MRMEGDRTRVDMDGKMAMSMIVDVKTRKSWMLMHSQKMAMDGDLDKVPGASFCGTTHVDACLKEKGFRKTGSETIDGKPCTVYEGTVKEAGKGGSTRTDLKIWRPNGLKEVPAIKVVGKQKGTTFETRITDIKVGTQGAGLFSVPKDYKSMGNPMDLMKKGMPGVGQ